MEVKIDEIKATIEFGLFGTFSERLQIVFEKTYLVYCDLFTTKYYNLIDNNSCFERKLFNL
tara:strand:- start:570 stop:752 length:183 start_codon:yes stop_codon:yes gene_type:complete